jgi:hypothetical protein
MADEELFLPQRETGYAASEEQYNASDILIGRIGCNISAGATGSGTPGSQAWINSVLANTPSYSFGGVIHEVIVFDRKLSETERQQMYGYLARKYRADRILPDEFKAAHTGTYYSGVTYWQIEHHPNTQGITAIPEGVDFGGVVLQNFLSLPQLVYRSSGSPLPDGTTLSNDTYTVYGIT